MVALKAGRSVQDLLDEYLPGETEEYLEFVIWGCTGWPAFWGSDDPEDSFRMGLAVVRWKLDNCFTVRDYLDQYKYDGLRFPGTSHKVA